MELTVVVRNADGSEWGFIDRHGPDNFPLMTKQEKVDYVSSVIAATDGDISFIDLARSTGVDAWLVKVPHMSLTERDESYRRGLELYRRSPV